MSDATPSVSALHILVARYSEDADELNDAEMAALLEGVSVHESLRNQLAMHLLLRQQLSGDGSDFANRMLTTLRLRRSQRFVRRMRRRSTRRRPVMLRWAKGIAALLMVAVAVGVVMHQRSQPPARPTTPAVSQPAPTLPAQAMTIEWAQGSDGIARLQGSSLVAGQDLRLGPAEQVRVCIGSRGHARIEGPAQVRITAAQAHDAAFALDAGRMAVEVQPGSGPLRITTPHGAVEVRGTTFSVLCGPADTCVGLDRGTLHVRHAAGAELLLQAGQRVRMAPGLALHALPLLAGQAVLVYGSHRGVTSADALLGQAIEQTGLRCILVGDQGLDAAALDDAVFVLISDTVQESNLAPSLIKKTLSARPTLCLDQGTHAHLLGQVGQAQRVKAQTAGEVVVGTTPHPITAGLPARFTFAGARVPLLLLAQALRGGGRVLLSSADDGSSVMEAADSHPRRCWFAIEMSLPQHLTPAAWQALDAAMVWLAQGAAGPAPAPQP